jgi:hypothetical protein
MQHTIDVSHSAVHGIRQQACMGYDGVAMWQAVPDMMASSLFRQ